MAKIIIIGGGVAAHEGAAALRAEEPDCEITILSREPVRPYRRPALTRLLAAELPELQFYLKPEAFYRENRIGLELNKSVAAIDRNGRTVALDDGGRRPYDRLLIAAGGCSFVPPLPGAELPGVFTVREYAGVLPLRAALAGEPKKVIVVGGGLLGLELAEALLKQRHLVTVIEGRERLLPRQLDDYAASLLADKLRGVENLTLLTGLSTQAIREMAGRAAGVVLTDGRELESDFVAFSIGMRPNARLAVAAGLATADNGGIEVDCTMKSSDDAIYAAGDCVSIRGVLNCGLFTAAAAMGRIAGANLAGGPPVEVREDALYAARFQSFGVRLFSLGDLGGQPDPAEAAGSIDGYRRIFRRDGRLTGAILLGDLKDAPALEAEIAGGNQ